MKHDFLAMTYIILAALTAMRPSIKDVEIFQGEGVSNFDVARYNQKVGVRQIRVEIPTWGKGISKMTPKNSDVFLWTAPMGKYIPTYLVYRVGFSIMQHILYTQICHHEKCFTIWKHLKLSKHEQHNLQPDQIVFTLSPQRRRYRVANSAR